MWVVTRQGNKKILLTWDKRANQVTSVKLQFKGNAVFPVIRANADSHCFYRHRKDNDHWIVTIGVGGKNLK